MFKVVTEENGQIRLVNLLFGVTSITPLQNGCVLRTTNGENVKVRNGLEEFAKYDIEVMYASLLESLNKETIVNIHNESKPEEYQIENIDYNDKELLLEVEKEYYNDYDKLENPTELSEVKNEEPKKRGRPTKSIV